MECVVSSTNRMMFLIFFCIFRAAGNAFSFGITRSFLRFDLKFQTSLDAMAPPRGLVASCMPTRDPKELQEMIYECQRWSERARMQLNASEPLIR